MAQQIADNRIAELIDQFPRDGIGGSVLITAAFRPRGLSLPPRWWPLFWKFDGFDKNMTCGSENPTDPDKTHRVLTTILPAEY